MCGSGSGFDHGNECPVVSSFSEFHHAIAQREERVIFTNTYVLAGMINGTTLAYDDISGDSGLTTEDLYPQALAL